MLLRLKYFFLCAIMASSLLSCSGDDDTDTDNNNIKDKDDKVETEIHVEEVKLNLSSVTAKVYDIVTLEETVLPENAKNKAVQYSSSNIDIALVSSNGVVKCRQEGDATITVNTVDGNKRATCEIHVEKADINDDKNVCIDPSGKSYETVEIDGKVWMAENYAYLPKVYGPNKQSRVEPLCYVLNYRGADIEEAKKTVEYKMYGVLYNYEAARLFCPEGWRLPSDEEWKALEKKMGMPEEEINKKGIQVKRGEIALKFKSDNYWDPLGTNETGLALRPSGYVYQGDFCGVDYIIKLWTAREDLLPEYMYVRSFNDSDESIILEPIEKKAGLSVRYIKDKE